MLRPTSHVASLIPMSAVPGEKRHGTGIAREARESATHRYEESEVTNNPATIPSKIAGIVPVGVFCWIVAVSVTKRHSLVA
jgi:hypothetical protein